MDNDIKVLFENVKQNLKDIRSGKDYTPLILRNKVPGSVIISEGAGMDLFTVIKER